MTDETVNILDFVDKHFSYKRSVFMGVSPSPLHIAPCRDSGAELIVQLSQSSVAVLCVASSLRLCRDGTRHGWDWHTPPF